MYVTSRASNSGMGAESGWTGSGEPGRGSGTTGVGGSFGVGTVAGLSGAPGVPGSGSIGVTGASGTAGVGGSVGVGTSRTGIAGRAEPSCELPPNGEEIEKNMRLIYPGLEVANPEPITAADHSGQPQRPTPMSG
jgi:hypothetical protein